MAAASHHLLWRALRPARVSGVRLAPLSASAGDATMPPVTPGASGYEGFFGEDVAASYDAGAAEMFDPAVVDPVVDRARPPRRDGPCARARDRHRAHRVAARGARRPGRRDRRLRGDGGAPPREARRRGDRGRDRRLRHDPRARRVRGRLPRLQHDLQPRDPGRAGRVLRERRRAPRTGRDASSSRRTSRSCSGSHRARRSSRSAPTRAGSRSTSTTSSRSGSARSTSTSPRRACGRHRSSSATPGPRSSTSWRASPGSRRRARSAAGGPSL